MARGAHVGGRALLSSTPEELAYAEGVRAIEQQARMVDELRSRTGVLLTGASIVASFLGAKALNGSGINLVIALALAAFALGLAAAVAILWPREWRWAMQPRILLEDWADEPSRRADTTALRRFLAEKLDDNWAANQAKLDCQLRLFELAIVALAAQVAFWIVELA